jgi:hypothetical protein
MVFSPGFQPWFSALIKFLFQWILSCLLSVGADMRRREFIALLGGATAWPFAARAQSSSVPVIGILNPTTAGGVWLPLEAAFRQGLSDTGYTEGRNIKIEVAGRTANTIGYRPWRPI